jgi:hypothetical protein
MPGGSCGPWRARWLVQFAAVPALCAVPTLHHTTGWQGGKRMGPPRGLSCSISLRLKGACSKRPGNARCNPAARSAARLGPFCCCCAQGTQNTVVFSAQSTTQLLHNCLVRGNFVVSPGHNAPNVLSTALLLRGAAVPKLSGVTVEYQAVEASQFVMPTVFSMLHNAVPNQIANAVIFKVAAWGGGIDAGGKIVTGRFR